MATEQTEPLPLAGTDLTHLRPTTSLELLDRAFAILRSRPALFVELALLCAVPLLLFNLYHVYVQAPPKPESGLTYALWMTAFMVVWQIIPQWSNAAIIGASFQTLLFPSRQLTANLALKSVADKLLQLILTNLLVWAVLFVLGVFLPSQLLGADPAGAGLFAFSIALWTFFAAIYFAMVWALVSGVVVIERRTFVRAMVRSSELMRTRYAPGFFGDSAIRRLLLLLVFPALVMIGAKALVQAVSMASTGKPLLAWAITELRDSPEGRLLLLLDAGTTFVATIITVPWTYAALVLLYAECRMRREALDIQVRLLARGEMGSPTDQADVPLPE